MLVNTALANSFNYYLSLLTLIGGGILIIFALMLAYTGFTKNEFKIINIIRKYVLPLGFVTALLGTFFSLFYSDYLGYAPCGLCWIQRIFLYPQTVLFALAWYKKDFGIFSYTLWLSIMGFLVGAYHNYIQLGYNPLVPCPATGYFADCAVPPFVEFGFVTFPLMAMVVFGFIIFFSQVALAKK